MNKVTLSLMGLAIIASIWLLKDNSSEAALLTKENKVIAVLIDNSSTTGIDDRPMAMEIMKAFFGELTTLQKRKATRETQILLVLTTQPNKIAWKGSAKQLKENAENILEMIEFKETCSDLLLAFSEIDTALRTTQPDTIDIYSFSPLINVPFSTCSNDNEEILLPQPVPQGLLLAKLARQAETVKLFLVNDDQKKNYLDYMISLNLDINFDLQGLEGTRAQLSSHGGVL